MSPKQLFAYIVVFSLVQLCLSKDFHIFVSPTGSDTNNGTQATYAVKTVDKAVSLVNGVSSNSSDTVYVELLAGYHELTKTLHILSNYLPSIVIRSYQHQEVHLVGGKAVPNTAFKPVTDNNIMSALPASARQHVRVVHLPDLGITNYGTIQSYGNGRVKPAPLEIFYNGQPLMLARWPNEGFINIVGVPDGKFGHRFQYNSTVPRTWSQVVDPWVYGFWFEGWADLFVKVVDLNTTTNIVTLETKTNYGLTTGHYNEPDAEYPKRGGYFRFQNILSALDQPGEYYLDHKTGDLYVWIPSSSGEVKQSDHIYVSIIDTCVEMHNHAGNLMFSDFTLEVCRFHGIHGHNNKQIQFVNMEIKNTGASAIRVYGDARDIHINKCLIHDTDVGFSIEGGNRTTLESSGHIIENNEIYRYTRFGSAGRTGIYVAGVGATIRHNTIYNGRYSAISYSTANDVTIEWNQVHHVCANTSGCGCIRSAGDWTTRGNKIQYNILHDNQRLAPGSPVEAVMLVDHHSSTAVTNNVFFNNHVHVHLGGGRDNLVAHNVLYNASKYTIRLDSGQANSNHISGLLRKLHRVPYNSSLWTSRYHELATIDEQTIVLPEGNVIDTNLVYNTAHVNMVSKSGRHNLTDLYTITHTGAAMSHADFYSTTTGDFRIRCHARDWANLVNFAQVPSPSEVGPRANVGPLYLKRAAYNPLSNGNPSGCPTVAPSITPPAPAYLPDGSGNHTLYTVPKYGCWLKIDKCTDEEYAVGLDRDSWGEEHFHTAHNETACLQRAHEQWQYCGSYKNEQVAAIYGPTGATRIAGDGCFVAQYGCPKHGGPVDGHAQINGTVHRQTNAERQGAATDEENCLQRAASNWKYCGSFRNHPITYIYRPTGAIRTGGAGCWIHVETCPQHSTTKSVFYDAWGATNLLTDDHEEACLGQAFYYWTRCGSDSKYPVTAEYRPTGTSRTVGN